MGCIIFEEISTSGNKDRADQLYPYTKPMLYIIVNQGRCQHFIGIYPDHFSLSALC